MANESHCVTSTSGHRALSCERSAQSARRMLTSPPSARPPSPQRHIVPARAYMAAHEPQSTTGSDSMLSYLNAQVTAGNYLSRKPVRVNSTIRQVPGPIDIPSSPPLQVMERATSQDMSTTPRASHMDYDYQTARNPKLFHSNYRFTRHSPNPSHPFQLLPTVVKPAGSFAFQLEPLVEEIPVVLYRACGHSTEPGHTVVYRARPHTYREISAAELGAAYSYAAIIAEPLAVLPVLHEVEQDWRDKERHAQAFNYDNYASSDGYEEEVEQFVDAHDILVNHVRDRDASYASCYLDAVEEQAEEDAMQLGEQPMQAAIDVVMSDGLPQRSLYVRTSSRPYDEPLPVSDRDFRFSCYARTSSSEEIRSKNMIEVRSPGRAGKIIEAARMNGYRG